MQEATANRQERADFVSCTLPATSNNRLERTQYYGGERHWMGTEVRLKFDHLTDVGDWINPETGPLHQRLDGRIVNTEVEITSEQVHTQSQTDASSVSQATFEMQKEYKSFVFRDVSGREFWLVSGEMAECPQMQFVQELRESGCDEIAEQEADKIPEIVLARKHDDGEFETVGVGVTVELQEGAMR